MTPEILDVSLESLRKMQKSDALCMPLYAFLKHGTRAKDVSLRRWICLHSDKYIIVDGVLLNIAMQDILGKKPGRPVLPEQLQVPILQLYHDSSSAAHPGLAGTLDAIKKRYWWYQMNRDIGTYVASCHKCLSTKKGRNFKPPMTIRDPAPFPFAHICLDTLECSKTLRGNHLIQVVSDYHTRSVICWPTHSNTAEVLAHEIFEKVFSKHGAPLILFSDNGSSFTSDLFKNICKIAGIKQKFSSSFRPQTQGIVERANRTILTKLRTLISDKQDDWDLLLPHVEWSINSTPAYSTGHTPFMLLYGYNPPNMYDAKREIPVLHKAKIIQEQFAERLTMQHTAEAHAYTRLKTVQKSMKERHDRTARLHSFSPGDIVYLFVPRLLRNTPR
jgi:transposase InsO family protein